MPSKSHLTGEHYRQILRAMGAKLAWKYVIPSDSKGKWDGDTITMPSGQRVRGRYWHCAWTSPCGDKDVFLLKSARSFETVEWLLLMCRTGWFAKKLSIVIEPLACEGVRVDAFFSSDLFTTDALAEVTEETMGEALVEALYCVFRQVGLIPARRKACSVVSGDNGH